MNRIPQPQPLAAPLLDVRDLQIVLAVAASGSTVKAASRLHVTQSAVSRGLGLVEEKLGTRLFARGSRGLSPTAAGERLIDRAGALLAQMVELEREITAPAKKPVRVRLVCECYTAYRWLPSTLAQLRRSLSQLEIELCVEHTEAPVEGLLAGEVDVALLTTAATRPPLIEVPLFSDEVVFVVGQQHPLASRKALKPADLLSECLIIPSQTPPEEIGWFFKRVFGRTRPRIDHLRFPLTEAIVDAARAGLGIGVLSEWIAGTYLGSGDLKLLRLSGRDLRRPWRMAFTERAATPARTLVTALGHAAPRLPA